MSGIRDRVESSRRFTSAVRDAIDASSDAAGDEVASGVINGLRRRVYNASGAISEGLKPRMTPWRRS